MKKLFLLVLTSFFLFSSYSFAQEVKSFNEQKEIVEKYLTERNEIYFKFYISSKDIIKKLANEISIDNVKDNIINYEVIAYANTNEMYKFKEYNIDFAVMTPPSLQFPVKMSNNIDEIMGQWDVYPTYEAYVNMMNQFATTYPNICRIVNIGTTVNGRALLFAVISDSVNFRKPKPRFQYSSSMHGDETTGYVLMLRLIDTLLSGYGNNAKITDLVKNVEIWINPLANPDGTYYGGKGTVNGARRQNQNGFDLNRNFPDFHYGPNPNGAWQPETISFMNLFRQYNFSLSMNFHGGVQVLNYPWDCEQPLHPDDDWWIHVCKTYVDTVHSINSSYMTYSPGYPNIPGITNGYAWYSVYGGRQDYMTFVTGGREITGELSNAYILPPAQLPTYYGYNFKSFLNYIKECLYGVRGIVTDSITNLPLKAKIRVQGREYMSDSTFVFSDTTCGDYHRMLPTGTYTLIAKAPGHYPKTITGVYVKYDSTTLLNIKLRPTTTSIIESETPNNFSLSQNYPNPFNPTTSIKYSVSSIRNIKLVVYDILGKEVTTLVNQKQESGDYEVKFDGSKLSSGIYFYKLTAGDFSDVKSMILIK
ncbi:MAG: M14 family zinc carboxypeptidase [Ignavibacteriae bacterium]|nr:M14 family zinc carboxypeptidase [Ignavibacteriota bacterium]